LNSLTSCRRVVAQRTWNKHQVDLMNAQSAKDKEDQHPQSISSIRKANVGAPNGSSNGDGLDDLDIEAAHPTSLAKLFPDERSSSKIDLICTWSADVMASGNAKIYGEHHLLSLVIQPMNKTSQCPITITGTYPSEWSQDFEKNGPAVSQNNMFSVSSTGARDASLLPYLMYLDPVHSIQDCVSESTNQVLGYL
jgi:hypothetical protein